MKYLIGLTLALLCAPLTQAGYHVPFRVAPFVAYPAPVVQQVVLPVQATCNCGAVQTQSVQQFRVDPLPGVQSVTTTQTVTQPVQAVTAQAVTTQSVQTQAYAAPVTAAVGVYSAPIVFRHRFYAPNVGAFRAPIVAGFRVHNPVLRLGLNVGRVVAPIVPAVPANVNVNVIRKLKVVR